MGKVRNPALENGFLISYALGSFAAAWVGRHYYNHLAKVYSIFRSLAPGDPERVTYVEQLKASADKALLLFIIIGMVLLTLGIGREVHQRVRGRNA